MKITLISPYPDITSFGVRTLSSFLKINRHQTQLIFLPDPFGDDIIFGEKRYQDNVLDQVLSLCRNSQLIGISLMTNFFDGAVQITQKLKQNLTIPIIWGGIHPTIRPDESLVYADMVCLGEGEDALLSLLESISTGKDISSIHNIWLKRDGELIKNPLNPLEPDLDKYPFPDYSMDDHHIMVDSQVKPLTHELTETFLKKGTVAAYLGKTGYQTMTSRGCPYHCTYCVNNTVNKMYGGKGKLRWRSVSHIMDELSWVRKHMPYINYIWISDDEFLARKMEELLDFSAQYKEKIKLSFSCLVSPLNVTEEKLELLVDAGLIYVQMGVESGSAKMQELFGRRQMNNQRMMKAIRIINKFKDKMYPPSYDFLIDVPGETNDDRIDSLQFISDFPKPYRLQPFTLILYPGTHMYEKAKQDGRISDEKKDIYSKTYTMREPDYLNFLMTLAKYGKFPGLLLKFLIHKKLVTLADSRLLKPLIKAAYLAVKDAYHFIKRIKHSI